MTTSEPNRWFVLYVEPILDRYAKTYQNRITLDGIPAGPLGEKVRRIHTPRLSEFQPYDDTGRCVYALLRDVAGVGTYMTDKDIPELLAYLWANGYDFDYKATGLIDTRDNRRPITVAIYKER
jgi:hypothetical protein